MATSRTGRTTSRTSRRSPSSTHGGIHGAPAVTIPVPVSTLAPGTPAPPDPATATPAVAVRGLSRSYGGIRALIDMDLDVAPGTIHAVVGENGAGKSTLMKILAGAVRPDA